MNGTLHHGPVDDIYQAACLVTASVSAFSKQLG